MIAQNVVSRSTEIKATFQSASPFRHVLIDGFLDVDMCEALLADFPPFDVKFATDENGRVGQKAVVEKVSKISPAYGRFYQYINSPEFLDAMSKLTGIPDLIADETLFGGGTHENREGQGLDTHIDFNIDERRMLHRRINLLVYLNKGWQDAWGGAIELHFNPRTPEVDEIKSYAPIFNRALIFETNEYSWHGFKRITLPPDRKHMSRKSFSIYLYTKDRPASEVVAPHTTFYVPQPLPERFRAGYQLTEGDVLDLHRHTVSRDGLLEMYQRLLVEKEQRMRDFLQWNQNGRADYHVILQSRSWKFLMALQRLKFHAWKFLGF
jgi:hypothetical protein